MDILDVAGSVSVVMKPICTSMSERGIIRGILEDWRKNGITSLSNSTYASLVILVNKSSRVKKLFIDYRKLNP